MTRFTIATRSFQDAGFIIRPTALASSIRSAACMAIIPMVITHTIREATVPVEEAL